MLCRAAPCVRYPGFRDCVFISFLPPPLSLIFHSFIRRDETGGEVCCMFVLGVACWYLSTFIHIDSICVLVEFKGFLVERWAIISSC
ncbi:hypothetical protein I7I50_02792 [Histoplasma capsulatum G186AR]|uniref:Uncharacterized protein n=1 Tax=Ajellomyces capsulatus TaxID=5037 RepID=A0A8H7Z624_AJECA|nr:hypothetical protein I7I52_00542 [Histoplasma capsulatum]QSS71801.1 hypothetical protein I7I50_02792 [Histoplasma capsulatum G186AR]